MTSLTLVEPTIVHVWVEEASRLEIPGYVPFNKVVDSMESSDPKYGWSRKDTNDFLDRWALVVLETQAPVAVSCAGVLKEAASRPHGTYVPGTKDVPEEYRNTGIAVYEGDADFKYIVKAKQLWRLKYDAQSDLDVSKLMTESIEGTADSKEAETEDEYHRRGDIVLVVFFAFALVCPHEQYAGEDVEPPFWRVYYVPQQVTRIGQLVVD